ncbi:hypothetical protein B1756_17080 [Natrarchaeobaculum aegyptiacum]|uniref:Uncharacterized protein n=1 Tax=Natrarchaeobaculum aegyptiacum TaxID=745377 RepID=A0A2Z2HVD8_9EURY|nr:hypothetical protein [Natrarchaeobaculum aegyptiacum]ARS91266.1 hypothetical protein B1756_17080 [Natrarchaeobaculum aegyptiacum]
MCDQFGDCSNDGTCQLVLRNRQTGMELVEHHCKAHLVLRVWEVERDDAFEVVDARTLDWSPDATDPFDVPADDDSSDDGQPLERHGPVVGPVREPSAEITDADE